MGNLYQMKKGIAAILFHCSECFVPDSEDNIPDYATRHQYCPVGEGSWCKYRRDQATGASTYKAKVNIPKAVCDIIKPIFFAHRSWLKCIIKEMFARSNTKFKRII